VDLERFSPDPAVTRSATAVFVGRLLPHKGIHDLIEGLPDGIPLDVIGRPHDDRYLRDLEQLARDKPVRFRFDVSDSELVAAYRSALCVVLPSVYRDCYGQSTTVPELLGQTLLEGMACGAPGVATRVASLAEIVTDRVNGLLVPPNDPAALGAALTALVRQPEQARAMGRAARGSVEERFTWDAVVNRCLAIYAGSTAPDPVDASPLHPVP
jgi:glycosyltransferase involved in cell wall biosynthesis